MSALKLLVGAAAATLLMTSAAQAAVVLFDGFESYAVTDNGGGNFYDLNFNAFTSGLNVEDGTVDLIGTPNGFSLSGNGSSQFVDLDGSTNNGGILRTNAFAFTAGQQVTLEFDLAGNMRGGTDEWDYGFQTSGGNISFLNIQAFNAPGAGLNSLGNGFGPAFGVGIGALAANAPWSHYSISFRAGNSGSLTAYAGTTSVDNIGPLIDNFSLSIGSVPEPATWLMMIMGFGGVGAVLRRRRATAAFA